MQKGKRLSDSVADDILTMIAIEKRFKAGGKLPNENELSEELGVSRTTLREAIRILAAGNVLEIQRGKGTYVKSNFEERSLENLSHLALIKVNADDLYEMRLIFEPEAAVGGNIALVKDGDMIKIDIPNKKINVLILDEELERRRKDLKPFEIKVKNGYLSRYSRLVTSGCRGAVLE